MSAQKWDAPPMEWDSFWLATTAAATVATAIATGVTLWLRQRDRPEPEWEILHRESRQHSERDAMPPGTGYDAVQLVNAGDGEAYRVQVLGVNCFVSRVDDRGVTQRERMIPVVRPGETFRVRALHDGKPVNAQLRIIWTPAPTRIARPVTDVLPIVEGMPLGYEERRSESTAWRYRELQWWQLPQRHRQWASRRARQRAHKRTGQQERAMNLWRKQVLEQSPPESAEDKS